MLKEIFVDVEYIASTPLGVRRVELWLFVGIIVLHLSWVQQVMSQLTNL